MTPERWRPGRCGWPWTGSSSPPTAPPWRWRPGRSACTATLRARWTSHARSAPPSPAPGSPSAPSPREVETVKVRRAGDAAVLVETEDQAAAHRLQAAVRAARIPGVLDVVPGASTVLVLTDPGHC